ncbi:MAG: iron-sulfur cluster assembly accessory protein [Pseudomonadales bacterium]|jgi:Fe-S cluster assembly protein SufA/iron-sulfur cluster assembly protein|nr:iron-sulfur cluster assembly accessory protein [Pseudomonadales bacterium]|tara:strand:+ start:1710 stop:2117 length:408 start_codon:yes stop_codon:yes gene_type:complete
MSTPQITVSKRAQEHIRVQVQQTRTNFLRLGVKESGCNGFMYTLDFLESAESDDHLLVVNDGVTVCIKDQDLPLVDGTEIDMVTQGLNSALVFKNSNATSYCGCGESFALIDETEDSDGGAAAASDLSTDATRSS